jgi:hypothetical protein
VPATKSGSGQTPVTARAMHMYRKDSSVSFSEEAVSDVVMIESQASAASV